MTEWCVLQHQDDCPPGVLDDWAAARGVALRVVRPDRGQLPDVAAGQGVVVLGSDRSVNADVRWIAAELDWLRDVARRAPVLGICFGAQALAVALGGAVHREEAEIAWRRLEVDDALGCGPGPWLCWHNDFIAPPPDAAVLARSPRAVHAFAAGRHLGVQFHPEVTAEIVESWVGAEGLARDLADAGVDVAALRRDGAAHAPAAGAAAHRLFDAFAATMAP